MDEHPSAPVRISLGGLVPELAPELVGILAVPVGDVRGLVLFAHGSGSSRFSPRNGYVAEALYKAGLATLLFDLLTEDESLDRRNVFDVALLAGRLASATVWAATQPSMQGLPIGYFGASTGAAAALIAAAKLGPRIGAVVSRGGRPDLAAGALAHVTAPTLLIVGGLDTDVLALNRQALKDMAGVGQLSVVRGATHLFEEPGALDAVVDLATHWFLTYLGTPETEV